MNMLGWTFFLGISNLSFAFCFERNTKIEKWFFSGFLINGIVCIISSIIFAFGIQEVLMVWAIVLSITWFVYPLMAYSIRKGTLLTIPGKDTAKKTDS